MLDFTLDHKPGMHHELFDSVHKINPHIDERDIMKFVLTPDSEP